MNRNTVMDPHPIQRIAVIGAGLMGHGIALEFAVAGLDVRLHDLKAEALSQAKENIAAALGRLEQTGFISAEQRARAPERIRYSTTLRDLVTDADLVVESATENLEVKRRVFAELDRLCPPGAILASNSSSLVPSSYAPPTDRAAQVLGLHYFNPPYLLPCVEVVAGPKTAEATVQIVREFLVGLGKRVVTIRKEVAGFVANRLQAALFREALSLVERGVTTPDDIDAAVQYGIGRRYATAGPFEIFDLAGLDTVLAVGRSLTPDLESASTVSPILEGKVARGELGTKTGKGFHLWTPDAVRALRGRIALGLTRQAQWAVPSISNHEPFIGAWRLVSFEATADGQTNFPFGPDASGLLAYAATGKMSVILSRLNRAPFASADPTAGTLEEKAAAFDSCFAYAGTFEVAHGRVIHRLEHCTFPNWIGTEQVRFFRFEEDRLILETPPLPMGGRPSVSRLTWERIKP